MANSVTTSIVVQFSQGDSAGSLSVEVDDREVADGGLNGGKTSFLPGDPVALLLYKSSNVTLSSALASLGTLTAGTQVTLTKTEDVTFANETQASVKYPITGGSLSSFQWVGANLGTISVVDESTVRIPAPASGTIAVGIAKITYTTTATVYNLSHSPPGLSEYSIVAFFAGSTP